MGRSDESVGISTRIVKALIFSVAYIAVGAAGILSFLAAVTFISACRHGANGYLCGAIGEIGYGVSALIALLITAILLLGSELWLVNRRMVQLGLDPASRSVAARLFGSRFVVSLVFGELFALGRTNKSDV
jgi:hypothetical protein